MASVYHKFNAYTDCRLDRLWVRLLGSVKLVGADRGGSGAIHSHGLPQDNLWWLYSLLTGKGGKCMPLLPSDFSVFLHFALLF